MPQMPQPYATAGSDIIAGCCALPVQRCQACLWRGYYGRDYCQMQI